MTESLSIHIGGAGCRIGNTLWELYCMESGIREDGKLVDNILEEPKSFYTHSADNSYHPRCIFVDLEPSTNIWINKCHPTLYNCNQFLSGKECSRSVYACAYTTETRELIQQVVEQVRRMSEGSDKTSQVWLFNSLAGGTGSGVGKCILEELQQLCPKQHIIQLAVTPDPNNTTQSTTLDYYNYMLSFSAMHEHTDVSMHVNNEKIRETLLCNSKIPRYPHEPYTNINQLISLSLSCVTAGNRYTTYGYEVELNNFNPIPYFRYVFPSYYTSRCGDNMNSLMNLTKTVLSKCSTMLPIDHTDGRYLCCHLIYRAPVHRHDISRIIAQLRDTPLLEFEEWGNMYIRTHLLDHPPYISPERDLFGSDNSVCVLSNHSAFKCYLENLENRVRTLLKKKAYFHWYLIEGMEESEFYSANELIKDLILDYQEMLFSSDSDIDEY